MRAINDNDVEKVLNEGGLELRPAEFSKGELAQALIEYFAVCGACDQKPERHQRWLS